MQKWVAVQWGSSPTPDCFGRIRSTEDRKLGLIRNDLRSHCLLGCPSISRGQAVDVSFQRCPNEHLSKPSVPVCYPSRTDNHLYGGSHLHRTSSFEKWGAVRRTSPSNRLPGCLRLCPTGLLRRRNDQAKHSVVATGLEPVTLPV